MTRLAVLADIHGNLPALQAVIADMAQFNVDHVAVAGDSVNCGPFSRETLELVTSRNWALIRGNNAFYALDHGTERAPANWADFTLPAYLREQLGAGWLNVLACLPDTLSLRFLDAAPVRVVHGIPGDPWTAISPKSSASQIRSWLRDVAEDTVICAHCHIPMERRVDRWHIVNPGSVGAPLDGDKRASYVILEGDHAGWRLWQHRRVGYDCAAIFDAFQRQRFVERCGVTARLIIDEFRTARLQLYPYKIWKDHCHPGQADSLALYDAFMALDDKSAYVPAMYR